MKCKLHMACSPRDGFTCSAGVLEIPYTIVLSSTLGVLNEELLLLCCIGNTCDALGTLGSAATHVALPEQELELRTSMSSRCPPGRQSKLQGFRV